VAPRAVKVAVTGASGFIGRALCSALARARHETVGLDVRSERFTGADVVVHLAAIAHRSASREELHRVNYALARQVGEAAAAHGASFVFLSSVKVHGEASQAPFTERSALRPQDAYAESKVRAEDSLRAIAGLRLAVLRPPLVYGPGVKANFHALMAALARGIPLPFASIHNRRSLIYVGNLVDAILRCLGQQGTFLVSDGAALATPELCVALGEALDRPARLFPFPARLLPGKLSASLEVDDSAIRRALRWRPPHAVDEGLRDTARWYRGR
jgi:nucleoside-diphosphate-sugar epimerase